MNQQIDQSYIEVAKLFDDLFVAANISSTQKDRVIKNLENAAMINIIGTLVIKLPPERASKLASSRFDNPQDLVDFFKDFISPDEFNTVASNSVKLVVNGFLENIK